MAPWQICYFYCKSGVALERSVKAIYHDFVKSHGPMCIHYINLSKWYSMFKDGLEDLYDHPRSIRPITEARSTTFRLVESLLDDKPRVGYVDWKSWLDSIVEHSKKF